ESGVIVGTFGISRDITAQIAAEQALAHLAMHDHLTGLVNRVAMFDRLEQVLSTLERRPARVAVCFVDLDDFKRINDSLGHHAGDEVLVEVARRLTSLVRRGDTVARLGGDEFVTLCTMLSDDDVRTVADRIVRTIATPIVAGGHDVTVCCSVGIATTSDPRTGADTLVRDADSAMYQAKRAGGRRYCLHDPISSATGAPTVAQLADELRRGIEKAELFLLYQPLYTLDEQSLRGVEALVRWQHPRRGLLLPEEFVPFAEEHGLIAGIDALVLDEACRQLAAWNRTHRWPATFTMSVNVSGRELSDPTLLERVRTAIIRHGIEPAALCLEVTETALMGEIGEIAGVLERIASLGVRIALDDFGTGYSTLTHLRRLKVDFLKIDRSFVERIGENPRDREIVAAVTALSHALGMSVVGEGIETPHQLEHLSALECDTGQGFLFAQPLAPEAVAALVCESSARQAEAG
ncbi:MAG TPA: bifunctional diguanylate cyclase/phosphodiesterase, partial [Acidimicrobiales bacterium]|nr:bifunctional diguanylate cyclase/phosphodiesterase [Acidimicrobiales bacterium]